MSVSIINGKYVVVKATFKDSQGNVCQPVANVTWSTSNAAVATVAADEARGPQTYYDRARITAVASGTATITASSTDASNNPLSTTISVTTYNSTPASMSISVLT